MSTVSIAGTLSVNNTNEDSKERILFSLQIAVKQIQHCISLQSEDAVLSVDVQEVKQLCESLDKALFHGLKCFDRGYWPFVREFTHKNSIKFLEKLENINSELQCGRAWLSLALSESSIESYFRSFFQNVKVVKRHYEPLALLCDEQRMQLVLMLMAGLEYVPINISVGKINYGNGLSYFENEFIENPVTSQKSKDTSLLSKPFLHSSDFELDLFDNAIEVTGDFKNPDTSPSDHPSGNESTLLKSSCSQINDASKTVSYEGLEMISRYINIDAETDIKPSENLEVIRSKVVRRTKRSSSQNQSHNLKSTTGDNSQTIYETNIENRLSKATTDSGLCLETPYSSDSELTDTTDDIGTSDDAHQTTFEVGGFSHDISVTFSMPTGDGSLLEGNKDKIEERGIPEGQEDPVENASHYTDSRLPLLSGNDGLDDKNDSAGEEEYSIYDLCKVPPVNHSAVNDTAAKKLITNEKKFNSLSSSSSSIVDIVSEEIAKLAIEKPEGLDLEASANIHLYFIVEVFEHEEESFYKLYCGYSNFTEGSSQRMYFLLSNKSAYFLKPGSSQQKFFKCGGLRYSSIDYIIVDLSYQSFRLVSRNKQQYVLYTASEELTREILSNLEIGIRRFIPKLPLPTVYTDATAQLIVIEKSLASIFGCEKSKVNIQHYSLARWEDYTSSSVTPSAPYLQDYLMYRHVFAKENKATQWLPGYFVLKAGVLYCMEEEKSKPLFFIQMCAPHCQGCRRIHLLKRPHAFEIIRSNSDSLQLAAADNYEASKWLQCFLETVSLAGHFIDADRNIQKPCCIMFANDKLVAVIEEPRKCSFKLLNMANICDLVSVFIDPVISSFLMLEFEIAEASKSTGEWIIYFESVVEKEKFLNTISYRWAEIFQVMLNVEKIKDIYLLKKYRQISEELKAERVALQEFCMDT